MGERPLTFGLGAAVDPIVDAGVAQILIGPREALAQFAGAEAIEGADEFRPAGTKVPVASSISSTPDGR